jgi:hypothetical protein
MAIRPVVPILKSSMASVSGRLVLGERSKPASQEHLKTGQS